MKTKYSFSRYQWAMIVILVLTQFTLVLDFMVMAPLGPVLMPYFSITPHQFSLLIASYAFSAFFSGVMSSFYADRFGRKNFLQFHYFGFLIGTLICGLTPLYGGMLLGRVVAGFFGGVLAAIVPTIIADLFPEEHRGAVIGYTQISFGICQIIGLPVALSLSNRLSWHAPFLLVIGFGAFLSIVIFGVMKPMREHLNTQGFKKAKYKDLLLPSRNRNGLLLAFLVTLAAYLLMPFTSTYNVKNLGMALTDLPHFYLFTGLGVIFFAPIIGKLCDRVGKFPLFYFGAFLVTAVLSVYLRLDQSTLGILSFINVLTFAGFFSMLISLQFYLTTLPAPEHRAGYLALYSSTQQLGGGVSVFLAGIIVEKDAEGKLIHFPRIGILLVAVLILSVIIVRRIQGAVNLTHLKASL
jgi:predicted MFS family arabinose efflux permease